MALGLVDHFNVLDSAVEGPRASQTKKSRGCADKIDDLIAGANPVDRMAATNRRKANF